MTTILVIILAVLYQGMVQYYYLKWMEDPGRPDNRWSGPMTYLAALCWPWVVSMTWLVPKLMHEDRVSRKVQMDNKQAYAEMLRQIRQSLVDARVSGDPDDLDHYARSVMNTLVGEGPDPVHREGRWGMWMICDGQVHAITNTDWRNGDEECQRWVVWTQGGIYEEDDDDNGA